MTDTRNHDEYYTASEVAEIKNIRRQSVVAGCQRSQYPGAYKTTPDSVNKQGIWMIPKTVVDGGAIKDIVTVTRALTPADLQDMIEHSVQKVVDERMKKFEDRLENHDRLLTETLRAIQVKDQQKKKSFWKFWK